MNDETLSPLPKPSDPKPFDPKPFDPKPSDSKYSDATTPTPSSEATSGVTSDHASTGRHPLKNLFLAKRPDNSLLLVSEEAEASEDVADDNVVRRVSSEVANETTASPLHVVDEGVKEAISQGLQAANQQVMSIRQQTSAIRENVGDTSTEKLEQLGQQTAMLKQIMLPSDSKETTAQVVLEPATPVVTAASYHQMEEEYNKDAGSHIPALRALRASVDSLQQKHAEPKEGDALLSPTKVHVDVEHKVDTEQATVEGARSTELVVTVQPEENARHDEHEAEARLEQVALTLPVVATLKGVEGDAKNHEQMAMPLVDTAYKPEGADGIATPREEDSEESPEQAAIASVDALELASNGVENRANRSVAAHAERLEQAAASVVATVATPIDTLERSEDAEHHEQAPVSWVDTAHEGADEIGTKRDEAKEESPEQVTLSLLGTPETLEDVQDGDDVERLAALLIDTEDRLDLEDNDVKDRENNREEDKEESPEQVAALSVVTGDRLEDARDEDTVGHLAALLVDTEDGLESVGDESTDDNEASLEPSDLESSNLEPSQLEQESANPQQEAKEVNHLLKVAYGETETVVHGEDDGLELAQQRVVAEHQTTESPVLNHSAASETTAKESVAVEGTTEDEDERIAEDEAIVEDKSLMPDEGVAEDEALTEDEDATQDEDFVEVVVGDTLHDGSVHASPTSSEVSQGGTKAAWWRALNRPIFAKNTSKIPASPSADAKPIESKPVEPQLTQLNATQSKLIEPKATKSPSRESKLTASVPKLESLTEANAMADVTKAEIPEGASKEPAAWWKMLNQPIGHIKREAASVGVEAVEELEPPKREAPEHEPPEHEKEARDSVADASAQVEQAKINATWRKVLNQPLFPARESQSDEPQFDESQSDKLKDALVAEATLHSEVLEPEVKDALAERDALIDSDINISASEGIAGSAETNLDNQEENLLETSKTVRTVAEAVQETTHTVEDSAVEKSLADALEHLPAERATLSGDIEPLSEITETVAENREDISTKVSAEVQPLRKTAISEPYRGRQTSDRLYGSRILNALVRPFRTISEEDAAQAALEREEAKKVAEVALRKANLQRERVLQEEAKTHKSGKITSASSSQLASTTQPEVTVAVSTLTTETAVLSEEAAAQRKETVATSEKNHAVVVEDAKLEPPVSSSLASESAQEAAEAHKVDKSDEFRTVAEESHGVFHESRKVLDKSDESDESDESREVADTSNKSRESHEVVHEVVHEVAHAFNESDESRKVLDKSDESDESRETSDVSNKFHEVSNASHVSRELRESDETFDKSNASRETSYESDKSHEARESREVVHESDEAFDKSHEWNEARKTSHESNESDQSDESDESNEADEPRDTSTESPTENPKEKVQASSQTLSQAVTQDPENASEVETEAPETPEGEVNSSQPEDVLEQPQAILGDEAAKLTAEGVVEENPALKEHEITIQWWGDYQMDVGEMGLWRIGPTDIEIHCLEHEWRIVTESSNNPLNSTMEVFYPLPSSQPKIDSNMRRYMFDKSSGVVHLQPRLSDRAIIVKPETPFEVRNGERITMYVSTPVWVKITIPGARNPLQNIASFRSPDIWYGEDTRSGELCYYSKLLGQLSLEGVQRRPYRVVTPMVLQNRSQQPLLIERIRLPMRYLNLYAAEDNFLWTSKLYLTQKRNNRTRIRIDRYAPHEMGKHHLVTHAELKMPRYLRSSAFSRFNFARGSE